jgi:hypothetical protein
MRSSAALLVAVLLAVSSVAGVGMATPADDGVRAPNALSDSTVSDSTLSDSTVSDVSPTNEMDSNRANETASNATVHDGTEMYVSVQKDGDAQWNVTARFVLNDENETAAFRDLAKSYENGDTDAGFSAGTFEPIVERVADDTNRDMTIEGVTRSARLLENGSVGILTLSFTWTNFTQVEEDKIVMGDAFWIGSDTWLPDLSEDQTLVIEGPEGYIITGASPGGGADIIDGNVLRYDGPQKFGSGDFAVTYSPRSTGTTPGNNSTGVLPDLSEPSGLFFLLFLFSLGGVGVYAWSQRQETDPVGTAADADEAPPTAPVAEEADEGDASAGDDADEDEPDVELLSDEERVLRLLRDNDGRMKQAQIVKETNWSNAKVSQLLSKMSDDGDVDKLRIGRENLITLPDEDVTDTE